VVGAGHDALDDAGVVPEVDEGEMLTVLAPAGHPAADRDLAPGVGRTEPAAVVGAQGRVSRHERSSFTCFTSSARGTRCCSPPRSGRTVTSPAATSSAP